MFLELNSAQGGIILINIQNVVAFSRNRTFEEKTDIKLQSSGMDGENIIVVDNDYDHIVEKLKTANIVL